MIHSKRFTCVLDTNVIFPITTRDILMWFAWEDLYIPKWSGNIFSEYLEVMKRRGFSEDQAMKGMRMMNLAFPDAMVEGYEDLIPLLELPDEDDRHVLAAAIKADANQIVTNNLKDFPQKYLDKYEISVKGADDFLTDIIDLNHEASVNAFFQMVHQKKNPPLDTYEVLDILRENNLKDTADYLHALI